MEKKCSNVNCEEENPQSIENFYKCRSQVSGFYSRCKSCCKKTDKKRKEKRKLYNQKWQSKNPNNKKQYYEKNKEIILKKIRDRNSTPEGKTILRNQKLKRFYNIDINQYNQMLSEQNHKCAICNIDEINLSKKMCVDHNHKNNQIRRLLCSNCNLLIGISKENTNILIKAAQYLEEFNNKKNNVVVLMELSNDK